MYQKKLHQLGSLPNPWAINIWFPHLGSHKLAQVLTHFRYRIGRIGRPQQIDRAKNSSHTPMHTWDVVEVVPRAMRPANVDTSCPWTPFNVWKNEGFKPPIWVLPTIGVTPKWMVYNGKPHLKWMIWGETHHFRKPAIYGLVITPKNEASIGSHVFFVVTNDGESWKFMVTFHFTGCFFWDP